MKVSVLRIAAMVVILTGCATTDITKTGKGFREATDPNEVEILMTRPTRPFEELGAVTASGWRPSETAKLHNSLRAKAAPLGANAVFIEGQGMTPDGWGGMLLWATGVAIRYTDQTPDAPKQ